MCDETLGLRIQGESIYILLYSIFLACVYSYTSYTSVPYTLTPVRDPTTLLFDLHTWTPLWVLVTRHHLNHQEFKAFTLRESTPTRWKDPFVSHWKTIKENLIMKIMRIKEDR